MHKILVKGKKITVTTTLAQAEVRALLLFTIGTEHHVD
jgi:CII-binding regulator of phage lambda lysogenization HflD